MSKKPTMRGRNWAKAMALGYPVAEHLPLIEPPAVVRAKEEVFDRLMALHPCVAAAFNFPSKKALRWLEEEGFLATITPRERAHLESEGAMRLAFQRQREAVYGLAWALSLSMDLDASKSMPDRFVHVMPTLTVMQTAGSARSNSRLRPARRYLPSRTCTTVFTGAPGRWHSRVEPIPNTFRSGSSKNAVAPSNGCSATAIGMTQTLILDQAD